MTWTSAHAWFTRIAIAAVIAVVTVAGSFAENASDGIRVMAREKSLAEQFLVILNDYGRKDIGAYTRAITRYAEAKANFDGLITQLEYELERSEPPNQSAAFQAALNKAVEQRVAFTSFVTDSVLPHTDAGQKSIVGDFIKGGGDLIKALTDAGIDIWREFRSAGTERRSKIKQELETLRWPQFSADSGKPG